MIKELFTLTLSSDLIVAIVKRSPMCRYFVLVESSDRLATYETHREGEPIPTRLTYTIEQAETAGMLAREMWRKYPALLLRKQASSALAHAVYPDVFLFDDGREMEKTA